MTTFSKLTVTSSNHPSNLGDDEHGHGEIISHQEEESRQLYWIQWFFLLFGIGVLIPFNAFMAAIEYFERRFCSEHDMSSSMISESFDKESFNETAESRATDTNHSLRENLESIFVVIFNLSSVFALGTLLLCQSYGGRRHHQRHSRSPDAQTEINKSHQKQQNTAPDSDHTFWLLQVPMTIFVVAFGIQAVFVLWVPSSTLTSDNAFEEYVFPLVTLMCVIVCGSCINIAQAGIVVMAGSFPSHIAMSQYVQGCAIGGVAVSFASFIAATWEDPNSYHILHCSNNDVAITTNNAAQNDGWEVLGITDDEISNFGEAIQSSTSVCTPYTAVDWGVFLYFLLGSFVLVFCIYGYFYVQKYRNKLREGQGLVTAYQHHPDCQHGDYETVRSHDGLLDDTLDENDSPTLHYQAKNSTFDCHEVENVDQEDSKGVCRIMNLNDVLDENNLITKSSDVNDDEDDIDKPNAAAIMRVVWRTTNGPIICICLTFFTTLSLFPAWTSQLHSIHQCHSQSRIFNDLYVPLTFVLFNVGDLIGRNLTAHLELSKLSRLSSNLVYFSVARIMFYPLLILGAGGSSVSFLDIIMIPSDIYSILVQLLFGVTNGILISASFISAPLMLSQNHGREKNYNNYEERMSEMLNFALSMGLFGGSSFSYIVVKLANGGFSKA